MAKKKTNSTMGLTTGVGTITVRTTVRKGNITTTYKTRFGFSGCFVPADLKKVASELKSICYKDISRQEPSADRITSATRIHFSECEYILPGNETAGD